MNPLARSILVFTAIGSIPLSLGIVLHSSLLRSIGLATVGLAWLLSLIWLMPWLWGWIRSARSVSESGSDLEESEIPNEHSSPNGSQPESPQTWAYAKFDFVRTFPQVFWISTVGYDSRAPDGFRYKILTTRHEPENMIELLLLRQMEDGTKQIVTHMEAPIDKFNATDRMTDELEKSANVSFERFDLSSVRTFDEFRSKAIELGWETAHNE